LSNNNATNNPPIKYLKKYEEKCEENSFNNYQLEVENLCKTQEE